MKTNDNYERERFDHYVYKIKIFWLFLSVKVLDKDFVLFIYIVVDTPKPATVLSVIMIYSYVIIIIMIISDIPKNILPWDKIPVDLVSK